MKITNKHSTSKSFITKDGSSIKELMHPAQHGNKQQSLAEATVPPGIITALHKHPVSEEIYYILSGTGLMSLNSERFDVSVGDVICMPPNTPHQIENTSDTDLVFLCCCSPAYSDQDTALM